MTTSARAVALAALAVSVAIVAVLHVVGNGLSPVSHRLSEYANGPHGWLMAAAFVTLGIALIAAGIVIAGPTKTTRAASGLLVLAGVGSVLSAVFRTNVSPTSELIHSQASAFATVATVAAALLMSYDSPSPSGSDRVAVGLALVAAALLPLSVLLHDTRWSGLGQRALWSALILWLLRTAWSSRSRPAAKARTLDLD